MAESEEHSPNIIETLATAVTRWTGTTQAFAMALGLVLVWIATGPLFGYSDTWQLVINTGTTIVTFLMVFLIQRSQNKDAMAVNAKLNELIAALPGASNRLLNAEDLSEEEVKQLHAHFGKLVELARQDGSLGESHSIEEAEERHELKVQGRNKPS